jgi:hypothetical protein
MLILIPLSLKSNPKRGQNYFKKLKGYPFLKRGIKVKSNTKPLTMKRLLVVLALGSFVACNNGTSTEETVDSSIEAKKRHDSFIC